MWRFNLFGFAVTVEPWFWLSCFLLGGGLGTSGRMGVIMLVIWTVVVFVSITAHELGHAFAARKYGAYPEIRLMGLGGLTIMHGAYTNRWQSIFVSAAGPLASLALGSFVWLVDRAYPTQPYDNVYTFLLVQDFLYVNFFWTAVNLLPVLPLDGGQIIRDVLGPRRAQVSIGIGVVCAVAVAAWAFSVGRMFLGIMMLLLAFSNFQSGTMRGGVIRD